MTEIDAVPEGREPQIHRTRMTRIGRIFTDIFNPWASVSSVQSVFHYNNEPQINADERRYLTASDFSKITHRKVRKERKKKQQEPLCSPWLNSFSAPAHGRAPRLALDVQAKAEYWESCLAKIREKNGVV